ncbi:MAG: hypothetical protein WEB52_12395 [Dehalococcoidia bacterium]
MEKAHAFKALRLDQSADGQMVETAYWTLVRQAQHRAAGDPDAHLEIDALNEAYQTLTPDSRGKPMASTRAQAAGTGFALLDWFADWCADQALRTRIRWSKRNPEIAFIGGAVIVLMLLALSAGASALNVFLVVGVVCVAIWAPWRRTPPPNE